VKILVVDDEPDLEFVVRQQFREAIRRRELQFTFARNGVQALDALRSDGEIGLVLTDINMPEMDGLTLLGRLSEVPQPLRAVIVSAYGDLSNIRVAMNRGACDFLTKPIDLDDLESTVRRSIQELAQLREAREAQGRLLGLERDLELAERIQRAILPDSLPSSDSVELHGETLAARSIGGDFYDAFALPDGRLGFLIADVVGKGIPAALYMAMSAVLLRSTALSAATPAAALRKANEALASRKSFDSMYVTVLLGALDTASGEVTLSSAGHPAPLHVGPAGAVTPLPLPPATPVGLLPDGEYQDRAFPLAPGEALVLVTDGVTDAEDEAGARFGEERLATTLRAGPRGSAKELVRGLFNAVLDFSSGAAQADDVTAFALRRRA